MQVYTNSEKNHDGLSNFTYQKEKKEIALYPSNLYFNTFRKYPQFRFTRKDTVIEQLARYYGIDPLTNLRFYYLHHFHLFRPFKVMFQFCTSRQITFLRQRRRKHQVRATRRLSNFNPLKKNNLFCFLFRFIKI